MFSQFKVLLWTLNGALQNIMLFNVFLTIQRKDIWRIFDICNMQCCSQCFVVTNAIAISCFAAQYWQQNIGHSQILYQKGESIPEWWWQHSLTGEQLSEVLGDMTPCWRSYNKKNIFPLRGVNVVIFLPVVILPIVSLPTWWPIPRNHQ